MTVNNKRLIGLKNGSRPGRQYSRRRRVSDRVTSDIYTFSLPFFAGFDLFSKPSTKLNMARRSRAEGYSCVDKLLILSPFFAGYVSSLKQTRHDMNHA
jgi:hypothetical protein